MFFIDDIYIGYEVNQHIHITEKMHNDFCKLSGDDSPIHTDSEFSKRSNYKAPIGYAFLLTTLLSRIYGKVFPGGSELCLSQECNFKSVYYIGDLLLFYLKVIQINKEFKLITISVKVTNQDNKIIFTGKSIMKIILGENESF